MSIPPFTLMIIAALAAGQPVVLTKVRPVLSGVDGFPRIAKPVDEPQRRINRALDRLDARVRAAARDCIGSSSRRGGYWGRQVNVTMRGPEFLSYLVNDDLDCGGAHPNEAHSALVYDLGSGEPVDWAKLLPRSLTGKLTLTEGEDGVRVVTLASAKLFELYRASYDRGPPGDQDEKECREAIAAQGEDGPVPMLAWLDAKTDGLAVQFDLPHVMQACSEQETIPVSILRREGASERLLIAIADAHSSFERSHHGAGPIHK